MDQQDDCKLCPLFDPTANGVRLDLITEVFVQIVHLLDINCNSGASPYHYCLVVENILNSYS